MELQKINADLLNACIADKVDLLYIEDLLKQGAQPLGCVEDYGKNNLYDAVLNHYLGMTNYENIDDSVFYEITKLFIKYGMDISNPEVPYDDGNVINPLWSFAFYRTETAMKILALLLDNGLDVDSAAWCWGHKLSDLSIPHFEIEDEDDSESFSEGFKTVMLIASYPHIINYDERLQEEIWFNENDYDITKFRNWNDFKYIIEPTQDNLLNKSIIRIIEKATGKEVWKFGFEISPEEINK